MVTSVKTRGSSTSEKGEIETGLISRFVPGNTVEIPSDETETFLLRLWSGFENKVGTIINKTQTNASCNVQRNPSVQACLP